jgi:hypothetical protein
MNKSQFPAAEWWARRRRIDRIREILNTFPEMTEEDGEVLAGCLAALLRGRNLTPDQEAMYRWWWEWLSDMNTTARRQSRKPTLAEQVATALEVLALSKRLRGEMTDALARLQSGGKMTNRQAGLWGSSILPKLRAT